MKRLIVLTAALIMLSAGTCFAAGGKTVYMVINDSMNFDGRYITSPDKVQIQMSSETDLSDMNGRQATAYIRVTDDGLYELVRAEVK